MIARKTYYINADRTAVVAEDSPDAAFLLAREGSEISKENADYYGLTESLEPENAGTSAAQADEKAKTPAANKAAKPDENK